MNDLKTIRQLIKMMVDHDLTEIDLEGEGEKIKLKRGHPGAANAGGSTVQYLPAPAAPAPATAAGATPARRPRARQRPPTTLPGLGDASGADDEDTLTIDSPMVGTFYTASSPDADAFVNAEGDTVKPDTVVCIIEAMKVFNEIKAEVHRQESSKSWSTTATPWSSASRSTGCGREAADQLN